MDGIIVINKPKGITSREVVNKVCKLLNTKKVGHTGTLDPIATGVLVLCVGKATKLVETLTSNDKEYVATVKLGILTDTLDTDGTIIEKKSVNLDKDKLVNVLNSFIGTYNQEVPIYSAVKVNGKKLYEYARAKKEVTIPKRMVEIKKIKLIEFGNDYYKFKVTVSKGTYIRSLIRDIAYKLSTYGTMKELIRTKQGSFLLEDAFTLEDIQKDNYKLLSIKEALPNIKITKIDDKILKQVKNGMVLDKFFEEEISLLVDKDGREIAIYKDIGNGKVKPYKMIEV